MSARSFATVSALCLFLSPILLVSSVARADVITYEGLGAANTFGPSGNWFGNLSGTSFTIAQKFTPTVSGNFDELYAAIDSDMYTSARSYTLRLLADQSNSPGTVLWQTTSQTWPVAEDTIFHLGGLNGPWLTAGQSYWLQADNPASGIAHSWMINNQGYLGSFATSFNGGAWQINDGEPVRGLRVLVAVPEPVSLALLLPGLLLLRRRRN
jgi:hypothetical protein